MVTKAEGAMKRLGCNLVAWIESRHEIVLDEYLSSRKYGQPAVILDYITALYWIGRQGQGLPTLEACAIVKVAKESKRLPTPNEKEKSDLFEGILPASWPTDLLTTFDCADWRTILVITGEPDVDEAVRRAVDVPEITPAVNRWIDEYTRLEIGGMPRVEAQKTALARNEA
jgi:hypothetical protein